MVIPGLANLITVSRIIGVAFIFWLMPFDSELFQLLTIVIFTLIGATDYLDGWVARRYNIVSDLGKVLDPLADKILVLVFLPLLSMGAIKAFPVFLIIAREFGIMGLRVFAAKHSYIIPASSSGKIKTAITLPVCGILMARPEVLESASLHAFWTPLLSLKRWVHAWPQWMYEGLIWLTVLVTVWSFLDYVYHFLWSRHLRLAGDNKEEARSAMLAYIPNSVSFVNVLCGVGAIFFSVTQEFAFATALILIGMILDGLDGRIARKLKVNSELGEKIDTKADYTTFCIAPAFLLFHVIVQLPIAFVDVVAWVLAIAYAWSVHFRLKRFEESGHSDSFEGVPSPVGAAFLAVSVHTLLLQWPYLFVAVSLLNMGLMVSRFAYPHNQNVHTKPGFASLRKPTLLFIALAVLSNLGVPFLVGVYIHEVLLGVICIYYAAPLIPSRKLAP